MENQKTGNEREFLRLLAEYSSYYIREGGSISPVKTAGEQKHLPGILEIINIIYMFIY